MDTEIAYLAFSFFKISCFFSSVISMSCSVLSLNEKDKRNGIVAQRAVKENDNTHQLYL